MIAIKYLETLEKVADGNATKIFLPTEVSGILGSVGGIAELFKEDSTNSNESKNSKNLEIHDEEITILALEAGHRREIYEKI